VQVGGEGSRITAHQSSFHNRDEATAQLGYACQLFDGSLPAVVAVSAPEVMVKLVTPTSECFAELADDEWDILFDTLSGLAGNDGSLCCAGLTR
jgi:hypothetical protein